MEPGEKSVPKLTIKTGKVTLPQDGPRAGFRGSSEREFALSLPFLVPQLTPIRGRLMLRLPHEAPFPDSGATQGTMRPVCAGGWFGVARSLLRLTRA